MLAGTARIVSAILDLGVAAFPGCTWAPAVAAAPATKPALSNSRSPIPRDVDEEQRALLAVVGS